jgi:hypothetical protein
MNIGTRNAIRKQINPGNANRAKYFRKVFSIKIPKRTIPAAYRNLRPINRLKQNIDEKPPLPMGRDAISASGKDGFLSYQTIS